MLFPSDILEFLRRLSLMPYENLSKILALHACGTSEKAIRAAVEPFYASSEAGAGGTCFSSTYYLQHRLRDLGYETRFLMADKGRALNIHCGLLLEWEGEGYLLDPGYMIFEPLPLPGSGLMQALWCGPNQVLLEKHEDNAGVGRWRLWTGREGKMKYRFDFRRQPVGEEEFLGYWKDSFAFPMMEYPVLNTVRGDVQYYLQKRNLLVRTPAGGSMEKLDRPGFLRVAAEVFGVSEEISLGALEIVLRKNQEFFLR